MSIFYFPIRDTDLCSSDEDSDDDMENLTYIGNQDDGDYEHIDENSSVQKDMSHDTDKNISLGYEPHSKFSRGDEIYTLQNEFIMVTEKKFICSLDLLLDVFSKSFQITGCANVAHVKYHFVGTTLIINALCQSGHMFHFCSSHEVNGMYANNLQTAGSSYATTSRLAQFLNLAFPSSSTYFRVQRLYLLPAIDE